MKVESISKAMRFVLIHRQAKSHEIAQLGFHLQLISTCSQKSSIRPLVHKDHLPTHHVGSVVWHQARSASACITGSLWLSSRSQTGNRSGSRIFSNQRQVSLEIHQHEPEN